ncbi:MAG: DUF4126 domain-containing protein [Betaproteobacteria bacterium]|nr:DUF4126 domain-containing protein [Betaproteobacteria bacterium]
MELWANLAMAAALAWASGIRLYAVLFAIGLAGRFDWLGWTPPHSFAILSNPWVLAATGFLLLVEFLADKIPGIDSLWGIANTLTRIPAGAMLAAGVIGQGDTEAWMLAGALLGGSVTAGTHFLKEGSRAAINTSPEPVSNVSASFSEEAAMVGGLWLAIQHPILFLALLAPFVLLMIWLVPKLISYLVKTVKRCAVWLSPAPRTSS